MHSLLETLKFSTLKKEKAPVLPFRKIIIAMLFSLLEKFVSEIKKNMMIIFNKFIKRIFTVVSPKIQQEQIAENFRARNFKIGSNQKTSSKILIFIIIYNFDIYRRTLSKIFIYRLKSEIQMEQQDDSPSFSLVRGSKNTI